MISDLALFDALLRGAIEPVHAEPLLRLAAQPIKERAPFLGALAPALAHDDAAVRAAALRVLAGARGRLAFVALARSLSDPEPSVREAALEALRVSAPGMPARYALALFHRDPRVRALAIDRPPGGCEHLIAYLIPDPALRDRIELPAAPRLLVPLAYFERAGFLERARLRAWLAANAGGPLFDEMTGLRRRTDAEVSAILDLAETREAPAPEAGPGADDTLDDVMELFAGDDVDPESVQTFASAVRGIVVARNEAIRRRVAAAIVAVIVRRGGVAPELAGLLAVCWPATLLDPRLPRALRLAAIEGPLRAAASMPRAPDDVLEKLLACDLLRRDDGLLDLRVLAAILWYAKGATFPWLRDRFGEDDVLRAFSADPIRGAAILAHDDPSAPGGILRRVLAAVPGRRAEILALAVHVRATEDVELVLDLDRADALELAFGLEELRGRPELRYTPAKLDRCGDAIARVLATDVDAERAFLLRLLDLDDPARRTFLTSVLAKLVRAMAGVEAFVARVRDLDEPRLARFVAVLPDVPLLPIAHEIALAHALLDHPSAAIRGWASGRMPRLTLEAGSISATARALTPAQISRIESAAPADLEVAIAPALAQGSRGLASALAGRRAFPSVPACSALLACHDDPIEVARQLARFSDDRGSFWTKLDADVVRRWRGKQDALPVLGNAWLHLYEPHAFALVSALESSPLGVLGALEAALDLPCTMLVKQVWAGAATVLEIWRSRERARIEPLATDALLDRCVEELDAEVGEEAARIVAAIAAARVVPEKIEARRDAIRARLPDLGAKTRERLRELVDARGVAISSRGPRTRPTETEKDAIARIRELDDLDALADLCRGEIERVVHEAAVRLLVRGGAAGEARLVALLAGEPPPCAIALADAVALFASAPAIDAIAALVRDRRGGAAQGDVRLGMALALVELGRDATDDALEAACQGPAGWLRKSDVDRLERHAWPITLRRALARSPHPHAYERALALLLADRDDDPEDRAAIRAFLDAGPDRRLQLRADAARFLIERDDLHGAPIVLALALGSNDTLPPALARRAGEALVTAMVEGALTAGAEAIVEHRLIDVLVLFRGQALARDAGLRRIVEEGIHEPARRRARSMLRPSASRDAKLRELAEVYAWGVVRGRELTGRLHSFHMTEGGALGYTNMRSTGIHVSPLPIFRRERHGREIVEGLVLHELGHHVYHSGEDGLAVWDRAEQEQLERLLNVVMDEHLERNLRARDPGWGDRLKTLGAWAFRHSSQDIRVETLLDALGGRAFEVLTRIDLGVAQPSWCIRVESGRVIAELDAHGHSFARFFRALRLGLGDRSGDPRVERALALFGKSFRRSGVEDLWRITLELRSIFGDEIDLVLGLGGPETIESPGGLVESDEGITDEDVQREVKRVLEPPRASAGRGGGGELAINVGSDDTWSPIGRVEHVGADPAKHQPVAAQVRRHADTMRRRLEEMGLRHEPQRMRLTGRRLDPTRIRALVTRGDPRILQAREIRLRTDLFLAILIDCSGSMHGAGMERAHAFGVLLAEAARGLRGVDLRCFGFTDRVIYDAGDAARCAITSLEARDGNNDAAALDHVARIAARSPRRAKLIVQISDGLPTECSVAALRAAVRKAARAGIACAQVAVRPLEEICFPHHVVIEGELDESVRRFGDVVTGLVRRVMT